MRSSPDDTPTDDGSTVMRALLAKIPRDRTLLLLLAPVIVVVALFVATRSDQAPPEERVSESAAPAPESSVDETGRPVDPDAAAAADAIPDDGLGGVAADGATAAGGSSDSFDGSSGPSSGLDPSGGDVPAWLGGEPSVEGAVEDRTEEPAASADSGTATTTPNTATTTTQPSNPTPTTTPGGGNGPEPAIDESPVAALLPMSAVAVTAVGLVLVARRRRAGLSRG